MNNIVYTGYIERLTRVQGEVFGYAVTQENNGFIVWERFVDRDSGGNRFHRHFEHPAAAIEYAVEMVVAERTRESQGVND